MNISTIRQIMAAVAVVMGCQSARGASFHLDFSMTLNLPVANSSLSVSQGRAPQFTSGGPLVLGNASAARTIPTSILDLASGLLSSTNGSVSGSAGPGFGMASVHSEPVGHSVIFTNIAAVPLLLEFFGTYSYSIVTDYDPALLENAYVQLIAEIWDIRIDPAADNFHSLFSLAEGSNGAPPTTVSCMNCAFAFTHTLPAFGSAEIFFTSGPTLFGGRVLDWQAPLLRGKASSEEIPEASTVSMFLCGLVFLSIVRRRIG